MISTRLIIVAVVAILMPSGALSQTSYEDLLAHYQSEERPLEYFERKAIEESQNAFVWHFLGLSQREARLESASLKSLSTACELAPNLPFHWQEMALAWERNGDFGAAEGHWLKAKSLESRPAAREWIESRLQSNQEKRATRTVARSRINSGFYLALAFCLFFGLGLGFVVLKSEKNA